MDHADAESWASLGSVSLTSSPSIRIVPRRGVSTPVRILISVLLPDPFSPDQAVDLAGAQRDADIGKHGTPV